MKFAPTHEQKAAIDAFASRDDLVLEAGAGTGKTSTLQFLAEAAGKRRGLYVAFNQAIAREAERKFTRNITVKTTHALAMAGTNFKYQHRLNSPKIPLRVAAARLDINAPLHVGGRNPVRINTQAALAMRAVLRFCSTSDTEITVRHVPRLDGLSPEGHAYLAPHIVPYAELVWADVSNPDGDQFKFEHDHYLKVWALRQPRWGYDFVLFDEAQDSNPVVSAMVGEQIRSGSQLVAVGDAAQAIYGWRGAVDAMQTFNVKHRLRLTQSFRFGPEIAAEANKWLALLGTDMRLTGNPAKQSRVVETMPKPDAILCRGNATVIGELFTGLEQGLSVGLVGGGSDLLGVATAAETLMAGRPTDHPEFSLFENWNDLVDYAESGADPNLRVLVKIVEDHGPGAIRQAVSRAAHEQHAQLIVSTAHKAKGREWAKVRIATDFAEPREEEKGGEPTVPPDSELMLSYVAVTRAMEMLDRGNLMWIDNPPTRRSRDRKPQVSIPLVAGPTGAMPPQGPPRMPPTPPQRVPAPAAKPDYIQVARLQNPNAYARWTEADDSSLLAGYKAGATLPVLMAMFGRNAGAIAGRVTKLLGLAYGEQDVFNADGHPLLEQTTATPQAPSEPAPASVPEEPRPDIQWSSWDTPDEPDFEEPEYFDEPDFDDFDTSDYQEMLEEQRSIRATFEYLMERDDI